MQPRVLGRAGALASAVLLLTTVAAQAETVTADSDVLAPGIQASRYLGTVSPGQDVTVNVNFILTCTGTSHVDANQMVRMSPGIITVPVGGSYGVSSLSFSPGAGWPADGAACPAGLAVTSPNLRVILTAPSDPGIGYRYSFTFNKSLTPTTAGDSTVFEGAATNLVFTLDVADNTPPTLNLPADSTVEGNTTGGALAAYTVSASDAEDAVAPTPSCLPAVGAVLPLGTNTIACTVTDGGGLTTNGSFDITVADTTAPALSGMPADQSLVTNDPSGATLAYTMPSATDVVDASPSVGCLPVSGSVVPVGTTTVTCTATDATGNHSSASFDVGVTFVPPVAWSAIWGEPVATSGDSFTANPGRSVPIKVEIFADRVEQTSGDAVLRVTPCGGGANFTVSLGRDAGRWTGKLDTSMLAGPGCYVAVVSLDGQAAGSFTLDLRGTAPASKPAGSEGHGNR